MSWTRKLPSESVTARTVGVVRKLETEEGERVLEGAPLAYLEDEEQTIEFDLTVVAAKSGMSSPTSESQQVVPNPS